MKIAVIAAMSQNRVIGKNNKLPWHLPNDLKFFKESTMGKPIIMGRKTFESIGRPLPGRQNIVITRNQDWQHEGVTTLPDVPSAILVATTAAEESGADEIMVIGGQQIYEQTLPMADRLYLTRVDADIEGDAFFPAFNANAYELVSEEAYSACSKNPYPYRFQIFERK